MTRSLPEQHFPDDDGAADPAVRRALAAAADGSGEYVAALGALQASRLLVPVVAILGEVEHDADGLAHDKSSDMAAVLITGSEGNRGLLAFTGLDALRAWDPLARPVPVPAQVAAASAVQEGATALVVDVAGPAMLAIEGDDLVAVASGWRLARVGEQTAWIKPG